MGEGEAMGEGERDKYNQELKHEKEMKMLGDQMLYICYCHNHQLKHKVEVLERDMEKEKQKVVGLEKKVVELEG